MILGLPAEQLAVEGLGARLIGGGEVRPGERPRRVAGPLPHPARCYPSRVRPMSDYTIKNLKEVQDMAEGRGHDMEARFGRSHIESEHLGVTYFRYGSGVR